MSKGRRGQCDQSDESKNRRQTSNHHVSPCDCTVRQNARTPDSVGLQLLEGLRTCHPSSTESKTLEMELHPVSSGFTRLGANWTSRHPDQLKSNPCIKKLESGQSLRRLCLSFPHDKHGSIRSEFLSESRVCSPIPTSDSPEKGRKTSTKLPASSALSSRGTSSGGPRYQTLASLLQSKLLRTRLKVVHSPLRKRV